MEECARKKNGVDFFICHAVVVIVSQFQACASLYLLILHQWDLLVGCLRRSDIDSDAYVKESCKINIKLFQYMF